MNQWKPLWIFWRWCSGCKRPPESHLSLLTWRRHKWSDFLLFCFHQPPHSALSFSLIRLAHIHCFPPLPSSSLFLKRFQNSMSCSRKHMIMWPCMHYTHTHTIVHRFLQYRYIALVPSICALALELQVLALFTSHLLPSFLPSYFKSGECWTVLPRKQLWIADIWALNSSSASFWLQKRFSPWPPRGDM